jgi:hypothetical protein
LLYLSRCGPTRPFPIDDCHWRAAESCWIINHLQMFRAAALQFPANAEWNFVGAVGKTRRENRRAMELFQDFAAATGTGAGR